jgi:hypothetical protein
MERLQFIAVLVWMIGMLVVAVLAMRALIRAENADHERRLDEGKAPPSTEKPSSAP